MNNTINLLDNITEHKLYTYNIEIKNLNTTYKTTTLKKLSTSQLLKKLKSHFCLNKEHSNYIYSISCIEELLISYGKYTCEKHEAIQIAEKVRNNAFYHSEGGASVSTENEHTIIEGLIHTIPSTLEYLKRNKTSKIIEF